MLAAGAGTMTQKELLHIPWLAMPYPKFRSPGFKGYATRCLECAEESKAAQTCGNKACSSKLDGSNAKLGDNILAFTQCYRTAPACTHQRTAHTECLLKRCHWARETVPWLASRYHLKNLDHMIKDVAARREHAAAVAARAKALLAGCSSPAGREAARKAVLANAEPRLAGMYIAQGSDKKQRDAALEAAFRSDAALKKHLRTAAETWIAARDNFDKHGKALLAFRDNVVARTDVKARLAELKAAAPDPRRFDALHAALVNALPALIR